MVINVCSLWAKTAMDKLHTILMKIRYVSFVEFINVKKLRFVRQFELKNY